MEVRNIVASGTIYIGDFADTFRINGIRGICLGDYIYTNLCTIISLKDIRAGDNCYTGNVHTLGSIFFGDNARVGKIKCCSNVFFGDNGDIDTITIGGTLSLGRNTKKGTMSKVFD